MKTYEEIQKCIVEAEEFRKQSDNVEETEELVAIIDTLNWILSDTYQHPLKYFRD